MPVLAIFVHHPNVVVKLRPGLSVDHIGLIWRTERISGGVPEDGVNVLTVEDVNEREIPHDILPHHLAE